MTDLRSHNAVVIAIRDAYARGDPAVGEDLLSRALDGGLPWDVATRAAAEGVASRMVASNLSLGGLYCTSSTDFPEMTRLAVTLLLPHRDESAPVDLEAVVVRRRELPSVTGNGDRYELALFFTKVNAEAREELQRFLGE